MIDHCKSSSQQFYFSDTYMTTTRIQTFVYVGKRFGTVFKGRLTTVQGGYN